ncbi:MAG TPA: hypothetical protein PKZ76_17085 [Xanthomonadaceae bacterium]|nr:hypothetical protein [Xanthomonadaceae bacterium]
MDARMFDALVAATGTGEVLTVCYNAGSRPGEARELVLLQIDGPNIGAKEPGGKRKLYKLDQIAWVEFSDGRRLVNADAKPAGAAKARKTSPPLSAEEEAQRQHLEEAIAKRRTLYIEMGTAADTNMDTVSWRGFIAPTGFQNHSTGLRVTCELEAEGIYFMVNANQVDGRRHLPIGAFKILGISDRKIDLDRGLVIDASVMLRKRDRDAEQ